MSAIPDWARASTAILSGCIGKPARRPVAYVLALDAFEEDCRCATVVVATREAPRDATPRSEDLQAYD